MSTSRQNGDFLDEIVDESTARDPGFPQLLADASQRKEAQMRLLLPHPSRWTYNEAQEARTCSGSCTVRYEKGIRMVTVPRPCEAHAPRPSS